MERSFEFAILRLSPDPARGESVNLGIIIFHEAKVDVRIGEVVTRARLLYPELSADALREGVRLVQRLGGVNLSAPDRHNAMRRIGFFALGDLGYFTADDDRKETYEAHVDRLLKLFTAPTRGVQTRQKPISSLNTAVRKVLRKEKVLANIGDSGAIAEHKIVPDWQIPNRPSLRADLALKNRIMRVCEIVELKMNEETHTPAALFEGVVTLDVAKLEAGAQEATFAYRASGPSAQIDEALGLASIHADRLINWDDKVQREDFLHTWISAARDVPLFREN